MVTITKAPPALSSDQLSLYYSNEPLLENLPVLVFYGPSTTVNSTQNSSRIQAHIYSLAGFHSFPRLTVAPTSPLYAAVNHLPSDLQGDELYRGLAISILSYFAAIPTPTKVALRDLAGSHHANRGAPMIFDEMHAADLASRMIEIEQPGDIASHLSSALSSRALSWIDIDVILPQGSMERMTSKGEGETAAPQFDDVGLPLLHYGRYTALVESLGVSAFLPTSKLQRAPSKPTALNRSESLSKDQKISLRREMCEMVDTENNYVSKIRYLVNCIAADFRQDTPPDIWQTLFPGSLSKILEINESFFQDVQSILDTTESDAIKDIDGDKMNSSLLPENITQSRRRDPTGATLFAKAITRWLPDFKKPYQDYLRSSADFPQVLARISSDRSSSFSTRLQAYGEQQLRSALIEPVQRLPRYSLLIDNISQLLPASHPALPSLLKARDMVTDICALDKSTAGSASSIMTLKAIVSGWPGHFNPQGRLITAIDALELSPPYMLSSRGTPMVILVFPGKIVLLQRTGENGMSARGLLAVCDQSSRSLDKSFPNSEKDKGLQFVNIFDLRALSITESVNGQMMYLAEVPTTPLLPHETLSIHTRVLFLQAPYNGKANRLSEEMVKAKLEGRYPVDTRENGKWSLRSISPTKERIGMMTAILEMGSHHSLQDQCSLGSVRLYVDRHNVSKSMIVNETGTTIIDCTLASLEGSCLLEVDSWDGTRSKDQCKIEDVVNVLRTRLENRLRSQIKQDAGNMVQQEASFNFDILASLPLHDRQQSSRQKTARPRSPVKLLSTMLGSSVSQSTSPWKSRPRAQTDDSAPFLRLPPKTDMFMSPAVMDVEEPPVKRLSAADIHSDVFKSPIALLEDTFASYIIALRSRSGNVVGKILQARASADELAVNELYNTLLEDPSRFETAAIVSVDVLFAAFEKFLRRAWRERMGPLLAPCTVKEMQSDFDAGKPMIFAQHFRHLLEEMSPQNRRAFASTIKLLSDLLDASGNDGDRGVLIASFAEALILVGNPHQHIMLLDRLVDDYDNLFEDSVEVGADVPSANGSLNRTRSFNTGSLSSNASSLRRRLGLGTTLTRENSKNESESKVASIWRTLSKNARSPGDASQQSSLSKSSLVRSRSTDTEVRMLSPSRPTSRDRPPTSSSINSDGPHSRPGSSHLMSSALSSIGEDTPTKVSVLPRKKRRSSLSDLQNLKQMERTGSVPPLQLRAAESGQVPGGNVRTIPKTPSPGKSNYGEQPSQRPHPKSSIPRFNSPILKENSPSQIHLPTKTPAPASGAVTISSYTPHKRSESKSNIPTPRSGLSERPWPPNSANVLPQATPKPVQKLRLQSPQKLRQRLSQEQNAMLATESNIQAEMSKIGEELSALRRPGSSGTGTTPKALVPPQQNCLQDLNSRLEALQAQLANFATSHNTQSTSIRSDLDTALLVSEKKVKKLDELYKEANAENEALYDRFNDELGRILGRVRKGEGVDELRTQLNEAQGEVVRLKGENAKLKREVVVLRSMMQGE